MSIDAVPLHIAEIYDTYCLHVICNSSYYIGNFDSHCIVFQMRIMCKSYVIHMHVDHDLSHMMPFL